MKKNTLFIYFLMLFSITTFAQTSAPIGPAPTDNPTFNYSSPDNFRATKIVEAKKGNDGNWYCLVKLEALNVKNNRPDITNYDEAPSFYNTVYILDNSGLSSDPANKQYYRCFHYTSYDPNISGRNEVSKYKCYNQYGPTGENGFFIWLKANYGTATQIGIVPNPGANSIPLPNYMGGNEYDIIYSISAYKGRFVNWYVRMETYPNGYLGPRQEPLKIDLVISRPSN